MKEDFNYCNYVVVFVDILRQREVFQDIGKILSNDENGGKLIKAYSETVLFVELIEGGKNYYRRIKK